MFSTTAAGALEIPVWLELTAVVVAVIGGTLCACERKLDFLGGIALGIICGLGGGLVRDVIMQAGGVYMLDSPYAIPLACVVALVVFFFHEPLVRHAGLIEWLDIIQVGLFAAAGCDKALMYGFSPVAAVFLGFLTSNGGGLLRDVFLGDVPVMFQKGNYYALCGIAGSGVYWLLASGLGLHKAIAAGVCVAVTVGLRRGSLHFGWQTSASRDLTPFVRASIRNVLSTQKSREHGCR